MPKALLNKIQNEYQSKGKSPKEAASIAYGTMNNKGYMHGSKETAAGASAESKFVSDHGASGTKKPPKKKSNLPPSIQGLQRAAKGPQQSQPQQPQNDDDAGY